MLLPDRNSQAEDVFVLDWSDRDDPDALTEVIEALMADRRPMLAARLVNVLSEQVEIEPGSALERAQQAARFVLKNKPRPEDQSWSAFEGAWGDLRRGRMNRMRNRQRQVLSGKPGPRQGRLDRTRRR
ncbi:MAG: hypothetical protein GWP91_21190 [Rhodobacterales bacterium]|nr:hypothetical protein [Rhodobacterales bacterium]